jgi:N-acetylglutamate synthase-like GNAT family acetyltransferase
MLEVFLLADRPALIEAAGLLRWREWGRPPEPEHPGFWVENTRREAGRDDGLPFTLVAVDSEKAPGGGNAERVDGAVAVVSGEKTIGSAQRIDGEEAVEGGDGGGAKAVAGVVGLGEFDLDDLRHHSPWVMGMVVDPAYRGLGVGRALMTGLEARAARLGFRRIWVATERAAGFYRRLGWECAEGDTVLSKLIDQADAVGQDHRLDAVAEVELGQDAGDVRLHGFGADDEGGRDLGVGEAGRDQS